MFLEEPDVKDSSEHFDSLREVATQSSKWIVDLDQIVGVGSPK